MTDHAADNPATPRPQGPLPLREIFGPATEALTRCISDVWDHGHQAGREEKENDQERRLAYHDRRVEHARRAGREEAEEALDTVLRLVARWGRQAEEGLADTGDLVWRLQQAGHPLPPAEEPEEGL